VVLTFASTAIFMPMNPYSVRILYLPAETEVTAPAKNAKVVQKSPSLSSTVN
jgi:hypothetical protein